ncbi:bacitracin ABC transporter ATP-binding protein [Peribacillus frigoritolerans]
MFKEKSPLLSDEFLDELAKDLTSNMGVPQKNNCGTHKQ